MKKIMIFMVSAVLCFVQEGVLFAACASDCSMSSPKSSSVVSIPKVLSVKDRMRALEDPMDKLEKDLKESVLKIPVFQDLDYDSKRFLSFKIFEKKISLRPENFIIEKGSSEYFLYLAICCLLIKYTKGELQIPYKIDDSVFSLDMPSIRLQLDSCYKELNFSEEQSKAIKDYIICDTVCYNGVNRIEMTSFSCMINDFAKKSLFKKILSMEKESKISELIWTLKLDELSLYSTYFYFEEIFNFIMKNCNFPYYPHSSVVSRVFHGGGPRFSEDALVVLKILELTEQQKKQILIAYEELKEVKDFYSKVIPILKEMNWNFSGVEDKAKRMHQRYSWFF